MYRGVVGTEAFSGAVLIPTPTEVSGTGAGTVVCLGPAAGEGAATAMARQAPSPNRHCEGGKRSPCQHAWSQTLPCPC